MQKYFRYKAQHSKVLKMSRSRLINVLVSSRTPNWTSRLRSREKWEGLVSNWKPNVSVSSQSRTSTSRLHPWLWPPAR